MFERKRKNYLCDSEEIKKSLEELFGVGKTIGIKYYRASISRYSGELFKEAWVYEGKKWKKEKNVKPDIIFDRSPYSYSDSRIKEKMASKFTFANDLVFDHIFNSKFSSYLVFKEWMPETRIAYSFDQLKDNLKFIKTSEVVIKPDVGSGGRGVEIINKKDVDNIKINKYPVVIQEFIDSSSGIKGLVNGIHDLRIIFLNQKPILSYVRQPKSGYVANYCRGGIKRAVSFNKIPKSLRLELKKITAKLKSFNDIFYSVDFFFDKNQKFYIIEINPSPGLRVIEDDVRQIYYKKLSDYIIKMKLFKNNNE
ncbi:MAG: ATP-grasp domain-containing protein [Minisyncoccia bacterium]